MLLLTWISFQFLAQPLSQYDEEMDTFEYQKSFKISKDVQSKVGFQVSKRNSEKTFCQRFCCKIREGVQKIVWGGRLACRSVFLKWKTEVSAIKGGAWGPTLRSKCLQSFSFFGRLTLKQKRLLEVFQKHSQDNLRNWNVLCSSALAIGFQMLTSLLWVLCFQWAGVWLFKTHRQ